MPPNIRWLLPRPAKKSLQGLSLFVEEVTKPSAEKRFAAQNHWTKQSAITTKDSKGKYVQTKTNEKQGECFVDDNNTIFRS
ncbi:hypothetical protein BST61_g7951 [Cercospora zeina]